MAIPITIPRVGWNMDEGLFAGWTKREGEQVNPGEFIFSLETDKALQEIECLDGGILRISPGAPKAGDKVTVGTVIGYLVAPSESPPFEGTNPAPAGAPAQGPQARIPAPPETAPAAAEQDSPAVSPRASRLAAELGIDCARLKGSGRGGRITEEDVRAASAATAPVGAFRRTIADRMMLSARSTAPVTLTTQVDAEKLVEGRERLKGTPLEGVLTPSYTEILVKLAALALTDHPALLARWEEGRILPAPGVHVGIAVDTPEGLVVPVVRDVPALSLFQLATRSRELVERALRKGLTPEDMAGGTFTVTTLGAFGIDAFTPIINYPQCAILGIGRIDRQPVVREDRVVPGYRMTLSLTFDHRIVDGAPAARFLAALAQLIGSPAPAF